MEDLPDQIEITSKDETRYCIYYIPGNPGLISYYHVFLKQLSLLTNEREQGVSVYGRSLLGFHARHNSAFTSSTGRAPKSFSLQDQIKGMQQKIEQYASLVNQQAPTKRPRIIIVSHSVGCYIALSVLHRLRIERESTDIAGCICLFPTIVDIAKSKRGRRIAWLLRLSWLPFILGAFAHYLIFILSSIVGIRVLRVFVSIVTRMTPAASAATLAFLESDMGVRQALHMAGDEMREITSDRWKDEIWGSAIDPAGPRLFFYFGDPDHWVADKTRDELIATRAYREGSEEQWRPRMEIDRMGIPHGFPIHHSEPVARKVAEYVKEIVRLDGAR